MNISRPLKFSIVMPNRDGSSSIVESLRSIFTAADGYEFEVIVVDDASTDESPAQARQFPVRLIENPTCLGAAPARNKGAREATGDLLVFIDNDVVIPPDTFKILSDRFNSEEVDAVIGLLCPITRFPNLCSQYKNYYMHSTYMKLPERVNVFYTSLAAIRREKFQALGGFDQAYRSATIEDLEFGIRVVKKGYGLFIDRRLQVDHIRYYGLKTLLKTAFRRSAGSTKIALRDRLSSEKKSYITTSPAFLMGIVLVFLALGFSILSLIFWSWLFLLPVIGLALGVILLNCSFLLGLAAHTRPAFFGKGAGLLLIDLFAHGCGNIYGIISFLKGQRY